jgi:hypothetical protein
VPPSSRQGTPLPTVVQCVPPSGRGGGGAGGPHPPPPPPHSNPFLPQAVAASSYTSISVASSHDYWYAAKRVENGEQSSVETAAMLNPEIPSMVST